MKRIDHAPGVRSETTSRPRARPALRARLELWLWRHGHWPLIAAALLCIVAAMWWIPIRAMQTELRSVELSLQATEREPRRPIVSVVGRSEAQRWAAFQTVLTPFNESTNLVRELVALTQDELRWTQAVFSQSDDVPLKLVRLQITVPVTGTYQRLHSAVERALMTFPNLSVDQILFKRLQVGQAQLEARIRMSIWLRSSSPAAGVGLVAEKAAQ